MRRSQFEVRSVDEITEDDLDNIAYRSKDKVWDKEKVGSTGSRGDRHGDSSGFVTVGVRFVPVGQLVSPVQAEDSGHEDDLSQWVLCGGQGSVLRAVSEEPLWGGCLHCAA